MKWNKYLLAGIGVSIGIVWAISDTAIWKNRADYFLIDGIYHKIPDERVWECRLENTTSYCHYELTSRNVLKMEYTKKEWDELDEKVFEKKRYQPGKVLYIQDTNANP